MDADQVNYKDNLLERLGGSSNLDFIIISYCENIKDDPSLEPIFGRVKRKNLTVLERELIMASLVKAESTSAAKALYGRVALRHRQLFAIGLNETHFDILFHHFSDALRGC